MMISRPVSQSAPLSQRLPRGSIAVLNIDRRYIPEVDGLRAIAVIAVMIYHAVPGWMPGGYAGVDVFFVISGFLITRILLTELELEHLRLTGFWERRARRIMPALIALLSISGIAAWLILSPSELRGFTASALASLLSAANLYFWQSSGGYFSLAATQIPLLHLWSLGVEEQFYLVYPLLLLLLWRWRRSWIGPTLGLLTLASLAAGIYATFHHPVAAFFLPFFRAWELGVGCLLALGLPRLKWRALPTGTTELASMTAALALLGSLMLLEDATPWPGWAAIPTVIATGVLIAAAPRSRVVGPILRSRPFVAIGLVSYSAYLWHHVLLAFYRVANPIALSRPAAVGILLLSLVVAAASYRLIERPARSRTRLPARRFWLLLAVGYALLIAGFAAIWRSGGAPDRLPPRLQAIASQTEAYPARIDPCFFTPGPVADYASACLVGSEGPVRTAIVGDSHASALAPGLEPLLRESGTRARMLAAAGCPFVENPKALSEMQAHCPAHTRQMLARILADPDIRLVAVAARWPYVLARSFYDNGEGGVEIGPDDGLDSDPARDARFARSLKETVGKLIDGGKEVLIVYPVPEPGWDLPKYLVHSYLLGRGDEMPTIDARRWQARAEPAVHMLDRLGERPRLHRVRPAEQLCGPRRCRLGTTEGPYYFDDDHPNRLGARVMLDTASRSQGTYLPLLRLLSSQGEGPRRD